MKTSSIVVARAMFALLLPVSLGVQSAFSETLLNDQFSDGDRTSQAPALGFPPYSSVPWPVSSAAYVTSSVSGLKFCPYTSGVSAGAWSYIAPQGAPISLQVGDSIKLTFDYTYNANYGGAINMLRFGLFNGGPGTRIDVDGTLLTQSTLQGYTAQTNAQTTSGTGSAIYAENNNGSAGGAFTSAGGGTYTKIGTDFPSVDASNVGHTAQMTVKRTPTGVDISVDTDTGSPGDEVTRSLAGNVLTSFDTVGFFHQSTGDQTKWVTFNNIKVERDSAVPPMPAGGFGTQTRGGLDGGVYKVTSLADAGPGTLRWALETCVSKRTVVFEVSGQISLSTPVNIRNPYITVAGDTAPSPGITVKGAPIRITTHDVVVRHLRMRVGNAAGGYTLGDRDGIQILGVTTVPASPVVYNVVVDHCSVSWSVDESISSYFYGVSDLTISNCIVSEALKNAGHPKGEHSMAVLVGPTTKNATLVGNILAHNGYRNPVVAAGATAIIANNIIYNYTHNGFHTYGVSDPASYGYGQSVDASVLNNVLLAGPEQADTRPFYVVDTQGGVECTEQTSRIYLDGNLIPGASTLVVNNAPYSPATPVVSTPPISLPSLQLLPASQLEAALVMRAGARPKDRDAVDVRIANEVQTRTGHSINTQDDVGGWPVLAQNYRLLTPPANLHADDNGNGISNLEEWLEGMRLQVDY